MLYGRSRERRSEAACLALAAAVITVASLAASCGRAGQVASTNPIDTAPAAAAGAGATMPHGDHNPHHGGIVLMKGDLHYELVFDRSGPSRLYFTDAVREDLPASIATEVTLTVKRPGHPDERIAMKIDDDGESWIGAGQPIAKTDELAVRVAFTIHDEPYWIDVPVK